MEKYKIIAKVESVNQGPHFCNITVKDEFESTLNIKLEHEDLENIIIGRAYVFTVYNVEMEEKTNINYISSQLIEEVLDDDKLNDLLPKFYKYAPLAPKEIKENIEKYINKIDNKILKTITNEIYLGYKEKFYIHPAATKFHHAYVGGLSYHTLSMLRLAKPFFEVYPYLNKDLLYSGIILHDIAKIDEMTGPDGEYTKEGQLIGHLVMGALKVEEVAKKYNWEDEEEVLLLKHMILSHHGQLNFGSPKKPQIGEALLLWFIDTMDSKFQTLGEVYNETLEGTFTQMVPVLDRMRFYKTTLKKK